MAKKNYKIALENVELQPQVIGYSYKKKSNIGRVIFIFIAFILVIYFINDISVFINNLLGKKSAVSIQELADEENINIHHGENKAKEDIVYYTLNDNLEISYNDVLFNNFKYSNNILVFDVVNITSKNIDLTNKKLFLELYNSNKTLLERFKIDINTLNHNTKTSFEFVSKNNFDYLVITEKNTNDYPPVNLNENNGTLSCYKDNETIIYTFNNNELLSIKHSIVDNNVNDLNYSSREGLYQNKVMIYNNINGITATFNSTVNGYSAVFTIELDKANLSTISEKYYYSYKEQAKVVKFEMQTYGFSCS